MCYSLVIFETGLGHEMFVTQLTRQIPILLIIMNNKDMSVSILLVYEGFRTHRAKGKSPQDVIFNNPVNFPQEDTTRQLDMLDRPSCKLSFSINFTTVYTSDFFILDM